MWFGGVHRGDTEGPEDPRRHPAVGWFVGFEVSPEAFARIRKGARLQLSIQGKALREQVA